MSERSWVKKAAGLGLVLALVAIAAAAMTMFAGGFTRTSPITVTAPRSGLVMDPDAKVKMRGVEVGRVKSIAETTDGATLVLNMNPDMLKLIPSNAKVDIKSTTVFGAKYVNFVVPENPSPNHLAAGATVAADAVTVEFNTLFQHLSDVLQKLEPEKLNATLGALSTALSGRGDELGQLLGDTDSYLKKMNPSLPALQRDFTSAAGVTNTYADSAQDFLKTIQNITATSGTIVDEQQNLDSLLTNVTGLANTAGGVLNDNEKNLETALDLLRPTTGLLDEYSPMLKCLIVGLDQGRVVGEDIFGGLQEGVALNAGFEWGARPYTYPKDLPKVAATGGPNCWGLPDPVHGSHAPFVVADTGTVPYVPNTQFAVNGPKIFQLLYAGLLPGQVPGR
ncbi:MCE family protein [Antrihabitans cavernicola]|uniref:MCE family protein n=1 Tax=Antrihabitans cavernicola TaxID=2495913 RepID=A0A5A7S9J9_9NOCA|nr:MCE family protein [Spelaeibacter cavernicola]KAA0021939.1 MCE family protein [Spelaeibacter cavernicola]